MQRSMLDALQMVYDMMEKEAASFANDEDAEFQAEEERLLQACICLDLRDQTMFGRHLLPRGLPCIAAYLKSQSAAMSHLYIVIFGHD